MVIGYLNGPTKDINGRLDHTKTKQQFETNTSDKRKQLTHILQLYDKMRHTI